MTFNSDTFCFAMAGATALAFAFAHATRRKLRRVLQFVRSVAGRHYEAPDREQADGMRASIAGARKALRDVGE